MATFPDRPVSCRTSRYAYVAGALVFVTHLATAGNVAAQRFKVIQPQIPAKQSKQIRSAAIQAIRDPASFQANRQALDDYFKKFYFPQMTSPAHLGQLGKARESLFKQYLRPAKVPAAQQHLTNLTLTVMRVISRDNYHPAVRYNAVLILGMLDQKYTGLGANANPPVPLPDGTKELLELLEQDEFNQVKVPASLKVGALVGLERHARFGVDAQYADRLTKAALAVIAEEQPPADLAADVHDWMRCQAARVLARQYVDGPNAQVQTALTGMIADANMSLEDRCCVAALLKNLKYQQQAPGIDAEATLVALGGLMKSVTSKEAEFARDFQQEMLGGRRSSRFGGARRGYEPTYERRRLLARVNSVVEGAKSLDRGLSDAAQQQVKELLAPLAPVMEVANDKNSLDLDITGRVIELEGAISGVVDSWQKPAEAPAEPAEGDFS